MKTKITAAVLGIVILLIVLTTALIRFVLTIDYIQMPFKIEWQKAIIYRNESKDYKFNKMQEKAKEGIRYIDNYYKEYPQELPTPKAPEKVEIQSKKTTVESFPKYLTNSGDTNRNKALEWMTAKWDGDNVVAFDNILKKESGYRADALNEIGAGGICQAYPASKMPCSLSNNDLMCQLEWCNNYIVSRYKTPIEAWNFHLINNWF